VTAPAESTEAIRATGLTKRFGSVTALDGVDLVVGAGQAVAVFGPNGAGKTTLIRLLTLGLRRDGGLLRIAGLDPRSHDREIRARIGLIAHPSFLYDDLSPAQNLEFYAAMYGVPEPARRARQLLELFGLAPRADDRVADLSRGMQQRVSVARALVHEPPLLLLDEPFTGLDAQAAERLGELLASLRRRGRTLVLVTHDLRQGLASSDRWILLARGRIAGEGASGTTDVARFESDYARLGGAAAGPSA